MEEKIQKKKEDYKIKKMLTSRCTISNRLSISVAILEPLEKTPGIKKSIIKKNIDNYLFSSNCPRNYEHNFFLETTVVIHPFFASFFLSFFLSFFFVRYVGWIHFPFPFPPFSVFYSLSLIIGVHEFEVNSCSQRDQRLDISREFVFWSRLIQKLGIFRISRSISRASSLSTGFRATVRFNDSAHDGK